MATLQQKNPCPGGHEIYNFGRPFLGHYYFTLSLYEPCPGLENKIFNEIHQFTLFTPKIPPLGMEGDEICNFLSPYYTDSIY